MFLQAAELERQQPIQLLMLFPKQQPTQQPMLFLKQLPIQQMLYLKHIIQVAELEKMWQQLHTQLINHKDIHMFLEFLPNMLAQVVELDNNK